MSTELRRETFGATERGAITLITNAEVDNVKVEGEPTRQGTKEVHVLREGGRTILTTESHAEAVRFARTLAGAGAIVSPGVDERRMGEVGAIAPHEHRIPTHEVRVPTESHRLAADEPARVEGPGPVPPVNPLLDDTGKATTKSPPAGAEGNVTETPTPQLDERDNGPDAGKADVGDKPRNAREAAAEGKLGSTDGNATGTPVAESGSNRTSRASDKGKS